MHGLPCRSFASVVGDRGGVAMVRMARLVRKTSTVVLFALGLAACRGRDAAPGGIPPPQGGTPAVLYDGEDLKAEVKIHKGKRILMLKRGGKTVIQVPVDEI